MRKNYYVLNDGELERRDNTIHLVTGDDRKPIPVNNVGSLHIMSQVDFNTRFFSFLSQKEIPAHYYNWFDNYSGSFYPQEFLNSGRVLVNQVRHYDNPDQRLAIAREIVAGATYNILQNLRYYQRKGKDVDAEIEMIDDLRDDIDAMGTRDELRGLEGQIRKRYYETFSTILRGEFELETRSKRPPGNEVNAMISFGNSLLYSSILTEIYRTHLNPTVSYLHEPRERRFSLSLDLSEVFKPVIVDKAIFKLVNKQLIRLDEFREEMDGCLLGEGGRKTFIQEFEDRLETTVDHETLDKKVSQQRLLRLEGYKLVKHVSGDDSYQSYRVG